MIGESSFQLLQEDHLHFNVVPVTIEAASLINLNPNDAFEEDLKYFLGTFSIC